MSNIYQIYLISDSTGETLDRIFTAIKAQFKNIDYKIHTYSFTRTENQILKILSNAKENRHQPSGQYTLNEEYYKRIEAIQFTMNHDDGNLVKDIKKSDIILLGVSRTSKTPTSIYLANKGFKISNIPLVNENSIPEILKKNPNITCIVGLSTEPERLVDIRKNRMNSLRESQNKSYTDLSKIKKEVEDAKNTFKKYKWPTIDVTRKSVEETAASIIKIYEIYKNNV